MKIFSLQSKWNLAGWSFLIGGIVNFFINIIILQISCLGRSLCSADIGFPVRQSFDGSALNIFFSINVVFWILVVFLIFFILQQVDLSTIFSLETQKQVLIWSLILGICVGITLNLINGTGCIERYQSFIRQSNFRVVDNRAAEGVPASPIGLSLSIPSCYQAFPFSFVVYDFPDDNQEIEMLEYEAANVLAWSLFFIVVGYSYRFIKYKKI